MYSNSFVLFFILVSRLELTVLGALVLDLSSELTPAGNRENIEVTGIRTLCKASALIPILFLHPSDSDS